MKTERSEKAPITRMKEMVRNSRFNCSKFFRFLSIFEPQTDKNATKNGTRDLNQTIIACNRRMHSFNIDHSNRGVSQGLINVSLILRGLLVYLSCCVSSNEACRILRDRASKRILFLDSNSACTCFSQERGKSLNYFYCGPNEFPF